MDIEPDLSICTVAGPHHQAALRRLLRSIQDTADPVSYDVMIAEIHQGSASGLADDFPGLLVIHTPGLSRLAAINQAIRRHGKGRYTAIIDSDVVILPECLKRLVDYMDETPDVGLASPRIVNAYGSTMPSIKKFPGLIALMLGSSRFTQGMAPSNTSEVDWCRSGVHLLRRECIEEIGLLDELLPVCAELDLYFQARRQGWHTMFVAEAMAVHANPAHYLDPLQPGLLERIHCLKKRLLP